MKVQETPPTWRTSSYSTNAEHCIEVRRSADTDVRDTKHRAGGHISVPAAAWSAFLERATR